jgi:tetratricopeptide (TPR) repeat protein
MPSTDPRADLEAKDIPTRTEAARQLAREGTVDDLPALLQRIADDKRASVRLYAAAAAADILARHRGAYDQRPLEPSVRRDVLAQLGRVDPQRAPGVLLCYAAFPEVAVLKRLARLVRDTDHSVRVGAAAAFRRMALSGAATHEGTGVREWVAEALAHPKLPTDAAADLVRLIGEAGWPELAPVVSQRSGAAGQLGEAVAEALERLEARHDPEAWNGVWLDEGRDVLELADAIDGEWLAIDGARPVEGRLELPTGVARRIWAPRLAEEGAFEALQMNGRTYWRLAGKRLVGFIEEQDARLADRADAAEWLLAQLDETGGAAALRAAVLLAVRVGRHEEALERLEKPLSGKRPRNDLHFLHGLALRGLGRNEQANASFGRYLEKAKAKEPWKDEAMRLLEEG